MADHHFLPQMYLRRWTYSVDPPMEPYVFVYYRGHAEPRRRAPRNIGYEPGFYRVDPKVVANGDAEALEKLFARIEGLAKGALDFVDRFGDLQDAQQRLAMADFVAGLFLRTRKEQRAQSRRALELVDGVVTSQVEKLGGLDGIRRLIQRFGGGPDDQSDVGLLRWMTVLATRVGTERQSRLVRLPSSCEMVSRHFQAMNMCIAYAPPLHYFVTSDSPVLLPTKDEPEHWWRTHEVGIGQDGAEIWCPLDPEKALLITRKAVPPSMQLDETQLEQVNHLCMRRCMEFVITHRKRPKVRDFVASLEPIDSQCTSG